MNKSQNHFISERNLRGKGAYYIQTYLYAKEKSYHWLAENGVGSRHG